MEDVGVDGTKIDDDGGEASGEGIALDNSVDKSLGSSPLH